MKKYLKLFTIALLLFSLTGCFKKDNYENIKIYTTVYPVEYIVTTLYGDYAQIESIYPNAADINKYKITNKKLNDFSKGDLFIYNGLSNEKQVAASLLNKNKNMDIIDVSQGLEIKSDQAELWLSPSSFLMMAQNIKNGLHEYITNKSILDKIDENYENIKVSISEFDAELKLIAENTENKKLIVANNSFKFLEKYGFEVISVSDDEENSNTNISKAKKYYQTKETSYIFELSGTEETDVIKDLVDSGAKKVDIPSMYTLTEEQSKNKVDYLSIIKSFIDSIKSEVY